MIKENYIFFDIDAKNKEEALDFVSSKAFEYGITDDKDGLLGDFLKREEEYSTGLQDEFAIPHAKSTHAKEVAIFFVKCKNELDWETLDDSKVATSLLEDEFKEKVKSSTDKAELKEYILKIMKEDN